MTREDVIAVLAEFFRDGFAEDAAGVGDWLAQGGIDPDVFVQSLDAHYPRP